METPTALIAWVISDPLARYEIIEMEITIKMIACKSERELEASAQPANSAPRAITKAIASKAHLDDEVGKTAKIGSAGISPRRWVNGETSVPAPTAKPVPVK